MIGFSFTQEKDRLAVQIDILTKDYVIYIFVVSNNTFRAEIIAQDYEQYKKAREKLPLLEPVILRAWEEFKNSFPKCPCNELVKKRKEILRLAYEVKAGLYRELKEIVELKDPEFNPPSYLVITEKEGKNEIPLN